MVQAGAGAGKKIKTAVLYLLQPVGQKVSANIIRLKFG